MTHADNMAKTRKTFFDALRDTQAPSDILAQMLNEMHNRDPDLFLEYAANAAYDPIDTDTINWNERYFSGQCKQAGAIESSHRSA